MLKSNSQTIGSKIALGDPTPNIGTMFINNGKKYFDKPAFAQRADSGSRAGSDSGSVASSDYQYWRWDQLTQDIFKLANYLLQLGLTEKNNRVAFVAGNNYQRLVCEMAVMSCGLVSVPIFAGYPKELMSKLIKFSDVSLLISDLPLKIVSLDKDVLPEKLLILNDTNLYGLDNLTQCDVFEKVVAKTLNEAEILTIKNIFMAIEADRLALIMYTSGTSGFPKGVQLSHANLMSQQKALQEMWEPEPGMRFLCYLPWHHSFGGLFERFFALHSGGCLAIDDSFGKNVDQLLTNFSEIKPHVYFSVPKIYQEIVARVLSSEQVEQNFFHPELKFVFTAAAPLPLSISDVFKNKGVPVVEGWGLTETSPCCTLTDFNLDRVSGVVGYPIPGVELTMGDENEIMVRGNNVMSGYFRNPEATSKSFTEDGWFKTGDIGEFTINGVKIISRKERMFKLDNGEKIFPAQIEDSVNNKCKFIKHAFVFGSGERHPFIIMFPNSDLFANSAKQCNDSSGCVNPRNASCLSKCLSKCIKEINDARPAGFEHVERALVINRELSLEQNELTPSFKLIPRKIEQRYREYIVKVQQGKYDELPHDAYVVPLTKMAAKVKQTENIR